jgi:hypothetical protein
MVAMVTSGEARVGNISGCTQTIDQHQQNQDPQNQQETATTKTNN